MENYTINLAAQMITVTKAFEKKCSIPETEEYRLLKQLKSDFPALTVKLKTHKTPSSYTTKSGETSVRNPYKNLTFDHMEKFMSALPKKEDYFAEYNFLKDTAAALQLNPYALVRKWFCKQFPKYKTNPLSYINTPIKLVKGTEIAKEAKTESETEIAV